MPPRPGVENSVQIASCGADKSIIFRDISSDHKGGLEFTRGNHIVGKTTLYDMETDVSDDFFNWFHEFFVLLILYCTAQRARKF